MIPSVTMLSILSAATTTRACIPTAHYVPPYIDNCEKCTKYDFYTEKYDCPASVAGPGENCQIVPVEEAFMDAGKRCLETTFICPAGSTWSMTTNPVFDPTNPDNPLVYERDAYTAFDLVILCNEGIEWVVKIRGAERSVTVESFTCFSVVPCDTCTIPIPPGDVVANCPDKYVCPAFPRDVPTIGDAAGGCKAAIIDCGMGTAEFYAFTLTNGNKHVVSLADIEAQRPGLGVYCLSGKWLLSDVDKNINNEEVVSVVCANPVP